MTGCKRTTEGPSHRRAGALRAFFCVAVAALAALVGSACLSPTLPLPPPDAPTSIHPSATGENIWAVTGDCDPGAIVTVFNEVTGKGAVVEDRDMTGTYTVLIEASLCDLAWVKQETGLDTSSRTTFVIEDVSSALPTDPSACP
jgi:hypothetical protein